MNNRPDNLLRETKCPRVQGNGRVSDALNSVAVEVETSRVGDIDRIIQLIQQQA